MTWQSFPNTRQWDQIALYVDHQVNTLRTVSDTKRAFYTHHTRPINSIYRRVVEELMVEMHLLAVNVDFRYNPIYALGVVSAFDKFMQGYQPEKDKESIFQALVKALEYDGQKYREDAQRLQEMASKFSVATILTAANSTESGEGLGELREIISSISNNPKFKYSRLFAIGLFTLLEIAEPDLVKNEQQFTEALQKITAALLLPEDKMQKDLELYRSNIEKMTQARLVLEDTLAAERKKREQRAKEKEAIAAANGSNDSPPTDAS